MLINDSTRSVILGDGGQASAAAVVVVVTAVATEKNYTIRCTRRTDEEKNLSVN